MIDNIKSKRAIDLSVTAVIQDAISEAVPTVTPFQDDASLHYKGVVNIRNIIDGTSSEIDCQILSTIIILEHIKEY